MAAAQADKKKAEGKILELQQVLTAVEGKLAEVTSQRDAVGRTLRPHTAVISRLRREHLTAPISLNSQHDLARRLLGRIPPGFARFIPRRVKKYIKARVLKLGDVMSGLSGKGYNAVADRRLLEESGLFDAENYRAAAGLDGTISPEEHYLQEGWRKGLEPSTNFEGSFLYRYYRTVGFIAPPAITYSTLHAAGWPVYPTCAQAEFVARVIRASDLFDASDYRSRLRLSADLDPALHYVLVGERLGHMPSGRFDSSYYRERHPDVAAASICCLAHYISYGRQEGRRPVSIAAELSFSDSRIDPLRQTVLILSHEASRTGAPIVAYNIAMQFSRRYNVIVLLLGGGELVSDFNRLCAAVIGPFKQSDLHPVEVEHIVRRSLNSYPIAFAIANSIESRRFVPALTSAFVPVILLMHEFASYTYPKNSIGQGLDWSTQIVFSTSITAESAVREHPHLSSRKIHVLAQGRCDVPKGMTEAPGIDVKFLCEIFRPKGSENALVVLGAGFVQIRKGVDLFLSCAAAVTALRPERPVRFIWIGDGYDPKNEPRYSPYLAEQIARCGLEAKVAIIDTIMDLEPAYAMTDVFFLSSRLDPLPNVAIEAAFHGLPIVCFENASGIANLLATDASLSSCVVPHLDVPAAARAIAQFANDEGARRRMGDATRRFAEATFDMTRYAKRLDEIGHEAMAIMRQRNIDFITLRDNSLFDENMFLPPDSTTSTREEAIRQFLTLWAAVTTSRKPATNARFRRPCAGFHPQVYAHERSCDYDTTIVNPLAHFIRSGEPEGPWRHEVIEPPGTTLANITSLRTGVHVHLYDPELASDFLRKLCCNRSRCDLLLSTDTPAKADKLQSAMMGYGRGEVTIRVVPNRGRDIGPFFTAFPELLSEYDVIGHFHSKRSLLDAVLGETWREFLWQSLMGDLYPMMDIIIERLTVDDGLGLVFAEDPHLSDWDDNLEIAKTLAKRMGIDDSLPPFFEFPNGTMFWCRPAALEPLFALKLDWHDYPEEPIAYDGTILHALERLLPFAARHAGYRLATTHVLGVTR
jgi:glycosyltransferase involved in cell wall biosynthesis